MFITLPPSPPAGQNPELKPFSHENKTQALSRHLGEMALELGDGAKFPTVAQLSSSLGVSIMTLNRALSELEARGLIVRRHAVGIFVTSKATQKTIALVTTQDLYQNDLSPFWSMLLEIARERVQRQGQRTRIYMAAPTPGSEALPEDLVEDVEAGRIQGAVVIGLHEPLHRWLLQRKLPAVAFGGGVQLEANVREDPAQAVRLGARELAKLGCQRISLWGPYRWILERPFQEVMQELRLPYIPEICHYFEGGGGHLHSEGQETATSVFGPGALLPRPDGVLIMDDMLTRGALTALHHLGLSPLKDIPIATLSNKNSNVLRGYENCLIRMEFDPLEIMEEMLQLLSSQLAGQSFQTPAPVQPHLILPS